MEVGSYTIRLSCSISHRGAVELELALRLLLSHAARRDVRSRVDFRPHGGIILPAQKRKLSDMGQRIGDRTLK